MSLKLRLGGEVTGAGLAFAVEEAMRMIDGPQYHKPTGWNRVKSCTGDYVGEALLHPGAWYPVGLVPEEKELPYHGRVAIYHENPKGKLVLEVARHNKEYKDELKKANGFGNLLVPLIAPFQAATMMVFNQLDPDHPERYAKVQYDDNIFVCFNPARSQMDIEFHVNALHPEYGGGVVKSMDDVHFQGIKDNFIHLCREACRELRIPSEDALDSLYENG